MGISGLRQMAGTTFACITMITVAASAMAQNRVPVLGATTSGESEGIGGGWNSLPAIGGGIGGGWNSMPAIGGGIGGGWNSMPAIGGGIGGGWNSMPAIGGGIGGGWNSMPAIGGGIGGGWNSMPAIGGGIGGGWNSMPAIGGGIGGGWNSMPAIGGGVPARPIIGAPWMPAHYPTIGYGGSSYPVVSGYPIQYVLVPVPVPVPMASHPVGHSTASPAGIAQPVVCSTQAKNGEENIAVIAQTAEACEAIGGEVEQGPNSAK